MMQKGAKKGGKKGPKNAIKRFKNPVFLLAEMWRMGKKTRKKTGFFGVEGSS
jgi:hypothetical protein